MSDIYSRGHSRETILFLRAQQQQDRASRYGSTAVKRAKQAQTAMNRLYGGYQRAERELGTGLAQEDRSTILSKAGKRAGNILDSPSAQTIDYLLQDARGLAEGVAPGGDTAHFDAMRDRMTDPAYEMIDQESLQAQRGLTRSARGAEAQMEDARAMRGAGRNLMGEAAQRQRLHEGVAREQAGIRTEAAARKAEVAAGAAQYMEQAARQFPQDAVAFAHNWVYGGGRAAFADATRQTWNARIEANLGAAGIEGTLAGQSYQAMLGLKAQKAKEKADKRAQTMGIVQGIVSIAAIALAVPTGGASVAGGAAALAGIASSGGGADYSAPAVNQRLGQAAGLSQQGQIGASPQFGSLEPQYQEKW